MFKRFSVLLLAIFMLVSPITVYADVVWSNSFLDSVRDNTIVLERNMFVIDSKSGTLTAKEEPGSNIDFDGGYYSHLYKNGESLYLTRVYKYNGEYWGIDDYSGHSGPSGWL